MRANTATRLAKLERRANLPPAVVPDGEPPGSFEIYDADTGKTIRRWETPPGVYARLPDNGRCDWSTLEGGE